MAIKSKKSIGSRISGAFSKGVSNVKKAVGIGRKPTSSFKPSNYMSKAPSAPKSTFKPSNYMSKAPVAVSKNPISSSMSKAPLATSKTSSKGMIKSPQSTKNPMSQYMSKDPSIPNEPIEEEGSFLGDLGNKVGDTLGVSSWGEAGKALLSGGESLGKLPLPQKAPLGTGQSELDAQTAQQATPTQPAIVPPVTTSPGGGVDYNAIAAGGPPPGLDLNNGGLASGAVGQAVKAQQGIPQPGQEGGTNLLDNFLNPQGELYDGMKEIEKMQADFYKNQPTSLMDTYRDLMKESGIPDLNEKLMDLDKIINGTEDDIRTEITKAGGFATDSQVQGMTNARNKSLIATYNNLLEMKKMATEQIGNMMQYAQQDRQFATQQFEQRMNFQMKKVEMGRQAQQFASTQLGNIASKVGYAGLLQMTGGDPYAIARTERALGMPAGGLQQLASMPDPDAEEKALNLDIKRQQLSNLRREASGAASFGGSIDASAYGGLGDSSKINNSILSTLMKGKGVSAGNRTIIGNTLALVRAASDLAGANPTGKFAGLYPGRGVVDFFTPEFMKRNKTVANESNINALNLQTQLWASGAALSDYQTELALGMVPTKYDTDQQVQTKTNQLVNYMMSQTSSRLITDGIDFTPAQIDFFNATPEDIANMDSIINQ